MNVSLTPELERLVNEKVESGLYQTASEVVREALRLLKERDQAREQLRADVQAGFDRFRSRVTLSTTAMRASCWSLEYFMDDATRRRRGRSPAQSPRWRFGTVGSSAWESRRSMKALPGSSKRT